MVTITYKEMYNHGFVQAWQKLKSTPTYGPSARQVHLVAREIKYANAQISKEFQRDIAEIYGKRDDKGTLIRNDGPESYELDETKKDMHEKAHETFGAKTLTLKCPPFTAQFIDNFKKAEFLSATDLEALGPFYVGNLDEEAFEKPPIPLKAV